jgi:hypothetical protein
MVINTVTVVMAQVAVAKRVVTVEAAVRATVISGVLFLGACALFGVSGGVSAGVALLPLALGLLGWLLLGGILLAAARATGPAVGWAVRSKENRLSERVTTREYEE